MLHQALAIEETSKHWDTSASSTQSAELDKAREILNRMVELEPELTSTYLTIANVCYMQRDYQAMQAAASKAIQIEEGNAVAHISCWRKRYDGYE